MSLKDRGDRQYVKLMMDLPPRVIEKALISLATKDATLVHLSPVDVMMVKATAAECCALCAANNTDTHAPCASWSFSGDKWTRDTPCHLSPYAIVSSLPAPGKSYCGGTRPGAPPAPTPPPTPTPGPPAPGHFVIDTSAAGRRLAGGIRRETVDHSKMSRSATEPLHSRQHELSFDS